MSTTAPICVLCIHLRDGGPDCDAFPDGIPSAIFGKGTFVHTEPYPGDHGIQFELDIDKSQSLGLTVRNGEIVDISETRLRRLHNNKHVSW